MTSVPAGAGSGIGFHEVELGPGVLAGFTDRHGGAGTAPYDTLNLGARVGDDPGTVARNRGLVADRVGARVAFVQPVHGADVLVVRSGDQPVPDAGFDVLVSTTPDVAVAAIAADCVPVLLADPVARVVAAAHVGRRGLVAGAVDAALDALVALGADAGRLAAAVGPAIAGVSYEVPAELRDEVAATVPESRSTTSWGTPGLDLPAGVEARLRARGVRVRRSARDTFTDPDLFSYRRDGATGRLAGVVRLLPPGADG
ncbi:polyphenol oxidase family protein [Cellulomonas massiliensis]|uniref:polyphenol oxidase family protein n=1 Tax=Cellulomonas massiliensis TaxID=1465811 RepID=UPI0002E1B89B|nr:polyphenol oxidase family protein [Cellulomonas massiliensis]